MRAGGLPLPFCCCCFSLFCPPIIYRIIPAGCSRDCERELLPRKLLSYAFFLFCCTLKNRFKTMIASLASSGSSTIRLEIYSEQESNAQLSRCLPLLLQCFRSLRSKSNHGRTRAKQRERKESRDTRGALLLFCSLSLLNRVWQTAKSHRQHIKNCSFFNCAILARRMEMGISKVFVSLRRRSWNKNDFKPFLTFFPPILAPRRFGVKVLHDDDDVGVNGIWKCRMSRRNLYLRDPGFPPKCKATKGFQVLFFWEREFAEV